MHKSYIFYVIGPRAAISPEEAENDDNWLQLYGDAVISASLKDINKEYISEQSPFTVGKKEKKLF